jgi:hypothetical protein
VEDLVDLIEAGRQWFVENPSACAKADLAHFMVEDAEMRFNDQPNVHKLMVPQATASDPLQTGLTCIGKAHMPLQTRAEAAAQTQEKTKNHFLEWLLVE